MQEDVGVQEDVEEEELQSEIGDGHQLVDDIHEGVMRGAGHPEAASNSFGEEAAEGIHAIASVPRTPQWFRYLPVGRGGGGRKRHDDHCYMRVSRSEPFEQGANLLLKV